MAALLDAATFQFPFYIGDWDRDEIGGPIQFTSQDWLPITIVSILAGALALVTIFLFKNRKLQIRLASFGLVLTVGMLALYFLEMQHFINGGLALGGVFHFAMLVTFILAIKGINKDEKLIKSMDRLR